MRTLLCTAAVALILSAGVELTVAQVGAVPGTGAAAGTELQLTSQQRAAIYNGVTKQKLSRSRPPANLHVSVGADLPASMELYDLPDNVASEVPATKFFKYTILDDEVVLVDPTKMKVVDIIGR